MLVASGIITLGAAFYLTCILPTQWVDVQHVYPALNLGMRILQVSDIHVEMLRVSPERVRREILKNDVDYVVLTGDFITVDKKLRRVETYLRSIQQTGVPVFAVLGNHDYRLKHPQALIRLLEQYHVHLLRNEATPLEENAWLVGIDDLTTRHSNVSRAFFGVPKDRQVVVITHDPNVVLHIPPQTFDYLMAGHLHGKQFRVPGLFQLKHMGPLPRRGVYQGLHRLPQGLIYISKGLGQVGINLRFLVRSELTVHHL